MEYQINNKWHKTEWAKQCGNSSKLGAYKCQGAEGHNGDCWCYKPNGPLVLIKDEHHIIEIKPEDPKYPHPKDVQHLFYMNISSEKPITDINKIQELNLSKYKLIEQEKNGST